MGRLTAEPLKAARFDLSWAYLARSLDLRSILISTRLNYADTRGSSNVFGNSQNTCESFLRNGASAELLRQNIAMRRLGTSPRNCSRWMFSERDWRFQCLGIVKSEDTRASANTAA